MKPPAPLLEPDAIDRVVAAALDADLQGRKKRRLLLGVLPRNITASLPEHDEPGHQLMADIDELARRVDRPKLLRDWLARAITLAGDRPATRVFERYLRILAPGRAAPTPHQRVELAEFARPAGWWYGARSEDADVRQFVDEVAAGKGEHLILTGVSGIGKSSTLGYLERTARAADVEVVRVTIEDNGYDDFLALLADKAQRTLDARPSTAASAKTRLVDVLGHWRAANEGRRLLLLIDQFDRLFESPSVRIQRAAMRDVWRNFVRLTRRLAEVADARIAISVRRYHFWIMGRSSRDLTQSGFRFVTLERLETDEAAGLLDRLLEAAEREMTADARQLLVRETECNPQSLALAFRETFEDREAEGPVDVGELVEARPWDRIFRRVIDEACSTDLGRLVVLAMAHIARELCDQDEIVERVLEAEPDHDHAEVVDALREIQIDLRLVEQPRQGHFQFFHRNVGEFVRTHYKALFPPAWADDAVLRDVKRMIAEEVLRYEHLGLLMDRKRLEIVNAHRDSLELEPEALDLMVRSSVAAATEHGYWATVAGDRCGRLLDTFVECLGGTTQARDAAIPLILRYGEERHISALAGVFEPPEPGKPIETSKALDEAVDRLVDKDFSAKQRSGMIIYALAANRQTKRWQAAGLEACRLAFEYILGHFKAVAKSRGDATEGFVGHEQRVAVITGVAGLGWEAAVFLLQTLGKNRWEGGLTHQFDLAVRKSIEHDPSVWVSSSLSGPPEGGLDAAILLARTTATLGSDPQAKSWIGRELLERAVEERTGSSLLREVEPLLPNDPHLHMRLAEEYAARQQWIRAAALKATVGERSEALAYMQKAVDCEGSASMPATIAVDVRTLANAEPDEQICSIALGLLHRAACERPPSGPACTWLEACRGMRRGISPDSRLAFTQNLVEPSNNCWLASVLLLDHVVDIDAPAPFLSGAATERLPFLEAELSARYGLKEQVARSNILLLIARHFDRIDTERARAYRLRALEGLSVSQQYLYEADDIDPWLECVFQQGLIEAQWFAERSPLDVLSGDKAFWGAVLAGRFMDRQHMSLGLHCARVASTSPDWEPLEFWEEIEHWCRQVSTRQSDEDHDWLWSLVGNLDVDLDGQAYLLGLLCSGTPPPEGALRAVHPFTAWHTIVDHASDIPRETRDVLELRAVSEGSDSDDCEWVIPSAFDWFLEARRGSRTQHAARLWRTTQDEWSDLDIFDADLVDTLVEAADVISHPEVVYLLTISWPDSREWTDILEDVFTTFEMPEALEAVARRHR